MVIRKPRCSEQMADIKALIKQGEGVSVEFKKCRRTLTRNVYETVCAFLNRHGGNLLLGVSDSGEVTGVDPDCFQQMKRDASKCALKTVTIPTASAR